MALQILNSAPDSSKIVAQLQQRIEAALAGAKVEVTPRGPGHFELYVESAAFEGKTRVGQQQLVYTSIAEMMSGKDAPVHAIDRMTCVLPGQGAERP